MLEFFFFVAHLLSRIVKVYFPSIFSTELLLLYIFGLLIEPTEDSRASAFDLDALIHVIGKQRMQGKHVFLGLALHPFVKLTQQYLTVAWSTKLEKVAIYFELVKTETLEL